MTLVCTYKLMIEKLVKLNVWLNANMLTINTTNLHYMVLHRHFNIWVWWHSVLTVQYISVILRY